MKRAFFIVLFVAAGAIQAASTTDDPLQGEDKLVDGWAHASPTETFKGSELYGHINGGAETFLELGFEALTLRRYGNDGDEISVELYRMTDPLAALGVYLMQCGKENRLATFDERHTAGRYQLTFLRNRYYVIVANPRGKDALVPLLARFAQAVASRLPEGVVCDELAVLPEAGRVQGTMRIVRGPFGLQSIYTLGEGDVLRLQGKVTAFAADYLDGEGSSYKRIAATYPGKRSAAEAFRYLTGHLDPHLDVLQHEKNRLVFKDYAAKFGEVKRSGKRLDIRVGLTEMP